MAIRKPKIAPETPAAAPNGVVVPVPEGCTVEFMSEDAKNVKFTPHPGAKHIRVFADGATLITF